jgi:hypothetical protein
MFHQKFLPVLIVFIAASLSAWTASAQITIDGVADKANYNDSVTYRVQTQAGFTDAAFLNGLPVPVGSFNTITRPDYYELFVHRTNDVSSAVTTRLVRFLVNASERLGTEWGLPPQTPFPLIQSSPAEFTGGSLRIMTPQDFPAGYEIPVVAWVMDADGHPLRANGQLSAPGHPAIQLRRGIGSGFLAATNPAGQLSYPAGVGGLVTNKTINIEGSTTWTTVSGILGNTIWPAGSRTHVIGNLTVPAGVTLTIEAGTIVRLNGGIDITNNGAVVINGTVEQPVVFMPTVKSQPWGGFISKTAGAGTCQGTGVIFTGSGANPSWFGSGGNPGSHRSEQALFYLDGGQNVTLTDAAAMYLAGQLGHSRNAATVTTLNFTRFLMQRCTSGGEYTGSRFTANGSAFIECPDDTINFVDGDNDALYLVDGTHSFTNTLFGWTKDDGIDSGGDGVGRLHYERCWFEATFHEGNSLSGLKNTTAHGTVYYDCGQGIEDGYGAGSGGPTGRVDTCLFLVCESGVRHGDNYPSIGNGYPGFITATNCILLQNHRDLFGYNWRTTGFTNAWGQFFANNNFLTHADTNFPNNFVWNPSTDAGRLIEFGAAGRVGVALAVRAGQTALTNFLDGVPVALSLFCTNPVSVDYLLETGSGPGTGGTLVFAPGEVRKFIPAPNGLNGAVRVSLSNPQNADLTGTSQAYFQFFTPLASTTLVRLGSTWSYLDDGSDQGTAWRAFAFNDTGWSNGVAELGFGDSPADEQTFLHRTNSITGRTNITFYFRHAFTVDNLASVGSLAMRLKRDDAGVVYLNGVEKYRSPNLPQTGAITYSTFATSTGENTIDTANLSTNGLQAGANVVAVEIHQADLGSSDISFDFELLTQPAGAGVRVQIGRFGDEAALYWSDSTFRLQRAGELPSAIWTNVPGNSPVPIAPSGPKEFYRLTK